MYNQQISPQKWTGKSSYVDFGPIIYISSDCICLVKLLTGNPSNKHESAELTMSRCLKHYPLLAFSLIFHVCTRSSSVEDFLLVEDEMRKRKQQFSIWKCAVGWKRGSRAEKDKQWKVVKLHVESYTIQVCRERDAAQFEGNEWSKHHC